MDHAKRRLYRASARILRAALRGMAGHAIARARQIGAFFNQGGRSRRDGRSRFTEQLRTRGFAAQIEPGQKGQARQQQPAQGQQPSHQ